MQTDLRLPVTIRPGRDGDAEGFISLIGACWSEYPSIVFDVDAEVPELHALASHYAFKGGALWSADANGQIVGMIGVIPHEADAWEIARLYVLQRWRGTRLAHRLLETAEAQARTQGATRLVLWSDTRFARAHRFYERRSYVRSGPIRVLNDLSNSLEFAYAKPVSGIETLDAAAAVSAEQVLADLLVACVDAGASVSYLPPLDLTTARGFWKRMATEVARGERLLLGGWLDGELVGTVSVDLNTPPNQPHRAEVQELLVHPAARRRGLARALMERAEQEAARAHRSLLTLDTRAGDSAELLYRATGWHEAGRIPGYALNSEGTPCETVLFWKELPDHTE